MHFDNRAFVQTQRIVNGHRCMRVRGRINDDRRDIVGEGFLYPGHQFAFVIGLAKVDVEAGFGSRFDTHILDVGQGLRAVDAGLSRAQLEDRLYGWDQQIESNAVEVYIHGLRRKLGSEAIRTLRGVGYFLPK